MFGSFIVFVLILLFLSWYIGKVNMLNDKLAGTSEQDNQLMGRNVYEVMHDIQSQALAQLRELAKETVDSFVDLYKKQKNNSSHCATGLRYVSHQELLHMTACVVFKKPDDMPVITRSEYGICYMWALTRGLKEWDNHRVLQTFAMIDRYLIGHGFKPQPENSRYEILKQIGVPEKHILSSKEYAT